MSYDRLENLKPKPDPWPNYVFNEQKERELREKYPALRHAWEHYQTLLKIAKAENE